jgi:hypothetical protein
MVAGLAGRKIGSREKGDVLGEDGAALYDYFSFTRHHFRLFFSSRIDSVTYLSLVHSAIWELEQMGVVRLLVSGLHIILP